jgi:hypothetical protein
MTTPAGRTRSLAGVWRAWTRFAQAVGDVQARLLLTVLYFLAVGLFAVPYRLFGFTATSPPPGPSFWITRSSADPPLVEARRQ